MDENKFWLSLWAIAAVVLLAGMGGCTYTSTVTRDKWEKAVANGADPMVTSCALGITTGGNHTADSIICVALAQNRK